MNENETNNNTEEAVVTADDTQAANTATAVTIYSTPSCHFCHMVKDYLTDKGVAYTEYDVAADAEKRSEMMEKTGQMGVPVVDINGEIVIGFNEAKIAELLNL